jgi:hypothetical protein
LGGTSETAVVLDRVGELMAETLQPVDHESLASTPGSVRWRNTAQWARDALVKNGLLAGNSRRGTWEITDAGRRYLEEQS